MKWSELARMQSAKPFTVESVRVGPTMNQILTWKSGTREIVVAPSLPSGTVEMRYGDQVVGRISNIGL